MPTLYPEYFLSILSAAGVPATPLNVSRLIERTAVMIGGQAGAYCGQGADPHAFREFVNQFAHGLQGDSHVVDRMVDWLWAWNAGCHHDLMSRFGKWRDHLLGPDSFLAGADEIPLWEDSSGADSVEDLWRLVYRRHARKR